MMTTKPKTLFLFLLPLIAAGCRTTPTPGFYEVQKTVRTRTGHNLERPRTTAENDQVDATVRRSLEQELTADSAVQIALLNNRSLRGTLEEIGLSRADLLQAGLLRNPEFAASFRFPDRPPSLQTLNTHWRVISLTCSFCRCANASLPASSNKQSCGSATRFFKSRPR